MQAIHGVHVKGYQTKFRVREWRRGLFLFVGVLDVGG